MSQKTSSLVYHRILLKLSGEALCLNKGYGIDAETVRRIAGEVQKVHALGVEIAVVIGGGNIWRGCCRNRYRPRNCRLYGYACHGHEFACHARRHGKIGYCHTRADSN